jgi:hypothetical protein
MRAYIVIIAILSAPTFAYAACDDSGGPGYRGPDGKCVSRLNIGKVCGCPPSTRCMPKNTAGGGDYSSKVQMPLTFRFS